MQQRKLLLRIVDHIDDFAARWGGLISYGVLLMIGITVYEVTSRYVFNRPTFWGHETTQMLYGAYIILGAGFTLSRRATTKHIKMDVFYMRLSPRKRAATEVIASTTFFLFVGVVLWQGTLFAWRSLQLWERSASVWDPYIWPLKLCVPIGVSLLMAMGVVRLIRNLTTVISREGPA